jgi:hypothetical protein
MLNKIRTTKYYTVPLASTDYLERYRDEWEDNIKIGLKLC